MEYQRAYWPMNNIKLSQGYGKNSSTHEYSYAMDICGKDAGAEEIFAPFDCKVTKLYQPKNTVKNAPEVWLTSTKKVLCANGYYGFLTMSLTHANEILKMKLGQTFKQFDFVCKEGKLGGATGNHAHLELSKGQTAGWDSAIIKKYKSYVNVNKVKPEEYLFVRENAKVLKNTYKGTTYNFIKESDITYKVVNVPSEPLLIHKSADYKDSTILDKKGLKNGDEVIGFYKKGSLMYIYNYSRLGYTASKYLKKV